MEDYPENRVHKSDLEKTNEWWAKHYEAERAEHDDCKVHVEELQRDIVHLQRQLELCQVQRKRLGRELAQARRDPESHKIGWKFAPLELVSVDDDGSFITRIKDEK